MSAPGTLTQSGRKHVIVVGLVLTALVILFDAVAGIVGAARADGHDISGSSVVSLPILVLTTPAAVLVTWWMDQRPVHPRLSRMRRLVAVGLVVGIPVGFAAFFSATFKY